jgi:hypothetical protein
VLAEANAVEPMLNAPVPAAQLSKGTLPSNSPVARKAEKNARANADPGPRRPIRLKESEMGFMDKVKYRATNLFKHEDGDKFKPVFLLFMGTLLGLSVYRYMKERF